MKKFMALFCILTLCLSIFAGCKNAEPQPPKDKGQVKEEVKPELTKTDKELFGEFLQGKITALDESGEEKFLDGGFVKILSDKYTYCYIDMTGDGRVELCVRNPSEPLRFFRVNNGKLYHWYTAEYSFNYEELNLLNNSAFLIKEIKDNHREEYTYYELDENGKEKCRVTYLNWYGGTFMGENGEGYSPESFKINEENVTKEEYEEIKNKYLAIGGDKIVWYDKDGNTV